MRIYLPKVIVELALAVLGLIFVQNNVICAVKIEFEARILNTHFLVRSGFLQEIRLSAP